MTDQPCNHPAWELLPWYANDTLSAEEHRFVAAHLEECAICRQELAMLREVQAEVIGVSALITDQAPTQPVEQPTTSWWRRWQTAWHVTPVQFRWMTAGQAAMVAGLALVLVLDLSAGPDGEVYTTQFARDGDISDQLTNPGGQLRVVFADDLAMGELKDLLRTQELNIVDGPSLSGVYTLAGDAHRLTEIRTALEAAPEILFVTE